MITNLHFQKWTSTKNYYAFLIFIYFIFQAGDVANIEIKSTEPSANAIYQVRTVNCGLSDMSFVFKNRRCLKSGTISFVKIMLAEFFLIAPFPCTFIMYSHLHIH